MIEPLSARARSDKSFRSTSQQIDLERHLLNTLTSRKEDAILVDTDRVDDGIVTREVVYKSAVRAGPLFDIVAARGSRCKRVFCRVDRN